MVVLQLSIARGLFRRGNLLECSAQVDGCGAQTFGRFPGNRPAQGVIHFEYGGAYETLQSSLVTFSQPFPGNREVVAA